MNKEELENAFDETTDNAVKLLKENVELKNRIDKAIKYIEQYCIDDEFYINLSKKEKNIKYALKILKGEDKEC